jgi:hypothetical protein
MRFLFFFGEKSGEGIDPKTKANARQSGVCKKMNIEITPPTNKT